MELFGAVLTTVVLAIACLVVLARVLPSIGAAGRRVVAAVVIMVIGVGLVLAGDVGGWEVESCGATASCPHPAPAEPDRILTAEVAR